MAQGLPPPSIWPSLSVCNERGFYEMQTLHCHLNEIPQILKYICESKVFEIFVYPVKLFHS